MRKRNKFSLSFYRLFTCKMGYLLPIGLIEVLPGDTIRHATGLFMRLAPMLAPVMHPCHVTIHTWYVPHRLVWDEFEQFITGGEDGLNTSVFPTITAPSGGFPVGSLADYLGVVPGVEGLEISALPFRAYNMIYNEWYRDQDLEEAVPFSTDSGPDTTTSTALLRGDWERDYFNTARPWPQKGLAVTVPVNGAGSGSLSVVSDGQAMSFNGLQTEAASYLAKLESQQGAGSAPFFSNVGVSWNGAICPPITLNMQVVLRLLASAIPVLWTSILCVKPLPCNASKNTGQCMGVVMSNICGILVLKHRMHDFKDLSIWAAEGRRYNSPKYFKLPKELTQLERCVVTELLRCALIDIAGLSKSMDIFYPSSSSAPSPSICRDSTERGFVE